MFALNQGEVCTCPSRALIQESIYDKFMERALKRVAAIKQANPLESDTMIGAQVSSEQLEKILSYIDIGQKEGAELLPAAAARTSAVNSKAATTCSPPSSKATTACASSRKRSSGPSSRSPHSRPSRMRWPSPTTRSTGSAQACGAATPTAAIASGRGIQAGRVWINCYHAYPAHAAFGGYKQSGIGRETHSMMLDHYQQTKNLLVSYSPKKLGFF
jgi:aldehyde dehydrogenase